MKADISLIVPVYNAEKFIENFWGGVLKQSYTDFFTIFVDDGSKDNSPNILDDISKRYNNVTVIHQNNKGAAGARNSGLDFCKTSFVCFADIDDTLLPDYIKNLMSVDPEVDMAISGFEIENQDSAFSYKQYPDALYIKDSNGKYDDALSYCFGSCWCRRFKTKILRENKLAFDVSMPISEDQLFVNNYYSYCQFVQTFNTVDYRYHWNNNSITKHFCENKIFIEEKIVGSMDLIFDKESLRIKHCKAWMWINCIGYYTNNLLASNRYNSIKDFTRMIQRSCNSRTFKPLVPYILLHECFGWKIYSIFCFFHLYWAIIFVEIISAEKKERVTIECFDVSSYGEWKSRL